MLKVARLPRKIQRRQIRPNSSPSFRGHLWRYRKYHTCHTNRAWGAESSTPATQNPAAPNPTQFVASFRGHLWRYRKYHACHTNQAWGAESAGFSVRTVLWQLAAKTICGGRAKEPNTRKILLLPARRWRGTLESFGNNATHTVVVAWLTPENLAATQYPPNVKGQQAQAFLGTPATLWEGWYGQSSYYRQNGAWFLVWLLSEYRQDGRKKKWARLDVPTTWSVYAWCIEVVGAQHLQNSFVVDLFDLGFSLSGFCPMLVDDFVRLTFSSIVQTSKTVLIWFISLS